MMYLTETQKYRLSPADRALLAAAAAAASQPVGTFVRQSALRVARELLAAVGQNAITETLPNGNKPSHTEGVNADE